MSRTVILTRPLPVHDRVMAVLEAEVVPVLELPTMTVSPYVDAEQEQHLCQSWSSYAGVMFVSQHAVAFAGQRLTQLGLDWHEPTWAAVVGQGSAQAIAQHWPHVRLVTPALDDAQDSDGLWRALRQNNLVQSGQTVLIVRAQIGRDTFIQRLQQANVSVDVWSCYRRDALAWSAAQRGAFCSALNTSGVVLSVTSADGLLALMANVPESDWPLLRQQKLVTLHPAIAAAAHGKGFTDVVVVPASLMANALIEYSRQIN
ncbi:uroporphyrinogen-III synthase [Formosimonas limnophila]|uniref:Uroporphyrinogen-III synthase n=1 Tax=Formosimonas limnophila TaxID=1384487 RepID=A0A8J3CGX4_9BURK|nr:uroporphyrinogen-III synthase [Formosimonas limnophila]GHA71803.1 uroporphyrinogen-III synthase [Formosimonas limnophila]